MGSRIAALVTVRSAVRDDKLSFYSLLSLSIEYNGGNYGKATKK